jgi:hypothetical protein
VLEALGVALERCELVLRDWMSGLKFETTALQIRSRGIFLLDPCDQSYVTL